MEDPIEAPWALAFAPDGKRLVACSGSDKVARGWEVESGKEVLTLTGHTSGVQCLTYARDGRHVVTGSNDRTVKVWDARTGKLHASLRCQSGVPMCVAVSRDSKTICAGSNKGFLEFWQMPRAK